MPRHRSLNLKKIIDSIPEPLIEEYFKQKLERGVSLSLKGNGRIYMIGITCTDTSNNSSSQPVTVSVVHDQGNRKV